MAGRKKCHGPSDALMREAAEQAKRDESHCPNWRVFPRGDDLMRMFAAFYRNGGTAGPNWAWSWRLHLRKEAARRALYLERSERHFKERKAIKTLAAEADEAEIADLRRDRERTMPRWYAMDTRITHDDVIKARHARRAEDKADKARRKKRDGHAAGVTQGDLDRRWKCSAWVARNVPDGHPLHQTWVDSKADVRTMRAWCDKVEAYARANMRRA